MLKILLGASDTETTKALRQKLIGESFADPDASFIAVVPEQATLQMQRHTVMDHPDHAVMNIDITSFERLAAKVFEELGEQVRDLLDDTGKVLILRRILEKCRQDLMVYSGKVNMPGFAGAMKSVITELSQYDMDDNDLFLMQEAAQNQNNRLLDEKLGDIRLIRRLFYQETAEKYSTSEEILSAFARIAERSGIIRGSRIYMEGFTGFTPIQYKVLEELMKYAAQVNISLTLPPEHEQFQAQPADMFYLSSKTYYKLLETARRAGCRVSTERLCKAGGQMHAGSAHGPEVKVFQAADITDEVRFIADRILRGVREEGKRFRDYAVICSDLETYYHVFRDICKKAQIPCFIDYKSELGDNAAARFLMGALGIVVSGFSYESVFALLKNPMSGFSSDQIDLLEDYCLEFGINSFSAWNKEFTANRKMHSGKEYWNLEDLNRQRREVTALLKDFYRNCSGSRSAKEFCAALKDFLEKSRLESRTASFAKDLTEQDDLSRAKQYEQIYGRIVSLLDQISELMGSETFHAAEMSDMIRASLEEMKIRIIPPSLDQVVIGDLTRTRLDDISVLFIAGVNEDKLPCPAASAGLLTEEERRLLKGSDFELSPTSLEGLYTQHFYLYLMMSKPTQQLYLTCASGDLQGGQMNPSYILEELETFGIHAPETLQWDGGQSLWKSNAADRLAQSIREYAADSEQTDSPSFPDEETKMLLHYYGTGEEETLEQILSSAFYKSQALPMDQETVLNLYGEKLTGSVSRYEKFYECPFKHFLNYGLNIQERPRYQIQSSDIGTVYHESLELYSGELARRGLSFRDISDEDSHEIAKKCVEDAVSRMESDAMTSTKRNEYMLERMTRVMQKTTDVLRMHVKQGLYEPSDFELPFSDDTHSAAFRGKIDRVDIYDGDDVYVKIIDYKSGHKKFSIRDIYTGQQLQLVAYLNAAIRKTKKEHPGRNVKAGGVYYYLIQDRFVKDEKELREKFRMSGLTSCEPKALEAIDTEAGNSGSSDIVEVSYTRSGLSGRSKVANDQEFSNLMHFVDSKINEAGERIGSGEVSISPSYESPAKNACTYCEYLDICKFEPGKWGCDYRMLPEDLDKTEMEKEIYGRNSVDQRPAGSD